MKLLAERLVRLVLVSCWSAQAELTPRGSAGLEQAAPPEAGWGLNEPVPRTTGSAVSRHLLCWGDQLLSTTEPPHLRIEKPLPVASPGDTATFLVQGQTVAPGHRAAEGHGKLPTEEAGSSGPHCRMDFHT